MGLYQLWLYLEENDCDTGEISEGICVEDPGTAARLKELIAELDGPDPNETDLTSKTTRRFSLGKAQDEE